MYSASFAFALVLALIAIFVINHRLPTYQMVKGTTDEDLERRTRLKD